jgi:CheY-like chemotaxis protein
VELVTDILQPNSMTAEAPTLPNHSPDGDTHDPRQEATHVLVVDDMECMLDFTRLFLEAAGYQVRVARDVAAALSLLDQLGPQIDGLMTDYRLPGQNGLELIFEVRRRWPHIKCLLTSGYVSEEDARRLEVESSVILLPKPFAVNTALQLLRQALGQ